MKESTQKQTAIDFLQKSAVDGELPDEDLEARKIQREQVALLLNKKQERIQLSRIPEIKE